ncbi:MAG TPA: 50S ribosomal protein L3 N(5)-glutamine methyltransferase, partial [Xanthomonadales bacterium]|nr:50S ribosomal protein L3 N(5)-glutamine methyltransferase [Xanthomonadales bacterium]
MVSVGKWVQKVTRALEESNLFYGHGTDNPRDEAAWLVLHAANAPLDGSFNDWNRPLGAAEGTLVLANLAERIERGMPLAYILGSAWFAGLEFEVDKSVLVPRSPIAELIFEHFQPWAGAPAINKVLDLCTGSGCIG